MRKKLLRKDGSTAWCGNIKPTGTEAGNLGAAVIAALAEGSVLRGADMSDSNMSDSNMRDSDIENANFTHADMCLCRRDDAAKLAHLNVCEWPVTIQFDGIHIGCKKFTLDEIMVMTEEIAASHHAAAPTRWRRWGKALQTLAQATLVHNKPEPETHGAVTPKPKRVRKSK